MTVSTGCVISVSLSIWLNYTKLISKYIGELHVFLKYVKNKNTKQINYTSQRMV